MFQRRAFTAQPSKPNPGTWQRMNFLQKSAHQSIQRGNPSGLNAESTGTDIPLFLQPLSHRRCYYLVVHRLPRPSQILVFPRLPRRFSPPVSLRMNHRHLLQLATTPMSIPPSSPAAPAPAFEPATPNPNNSTAMQSPPESRKRQRGDNSDNANDNGADSDGAKDDDTNGDGADNNGANDSNANNNRGQRRSKRIRTSSSTSRPSNTAATSKAFDPAPAVSQITSDDDDDASPEWFRKAVLMLSSKDLGGGWLDLVAIWSQFEKAAGYTEAGILSSEGRPTCVGAWIARARSPRYQPALSRSNLEDLDQSFWRWWTALQPETSSGLSQ